MSGHGQGPNPSTLDDLIQAMHTRLAALGRIRVEPGDGKIEWLVGERYEGANGCPPRIWVYTGEDGSLGAPDRAGAGYVAGVTERCTFYLWGDETTADMDRQRAAKLLGMSVINLLRALAPGRIKGMRFTRPVKTDILTYGEELRLAVEYAWNVPRDAAIWNVAVSPISPPDPDRPQGSTGKTVEVDTTVEPTR